MTPKPALLLLAALAMLASAAASHAAPFPNLECIDAKDLRGLDSGPARIDIAPRDVAKFVTDRNCSLAKPKVKMICTAVETDPIETIPSKNLRNSFVCYQLKCPAFTGNKTIETEDRLGAGTFELKIKSTKRILCLPTPRIDSAP